MRKTLYILLLLILVMQSGGILLVLNIQQCFVRIEMKEKLENDSTLFENLTLTLDQYKKCKIKPDEIFFNGNMYDIKSEIIVGDTVKLLAINDTKEKKILEKMNDLVESQSSSNNKAPNRFENLITLKYLSPEKEFSLFNPSFQIGFYHVPVSKILSEITDILLPPPRLA